MNKVLFAFAALFIVSCGNKVQQPEVTEKDNSISLPKYVLLSTEEPRVASDGHISPGQNLVYNIEIEYPLQEDSLKHLHDFFIQKGEKDYVGINKIIVRAYLKGTEIHRTPYATLNLVSGKKDVIINETATNIKELSQDNPTTEKVQEVVDPIVGTYFCNRTHDTYVFLSDKIGFFTAQGGGPSTFTWKRSGSDVTIEYDAFGKQKLMFDQKAKTITEKSESFGILVFNKQ